MDEQSDFHLLRLDDLLSREQAAEFCAVSPHTIDRWRRRGDVPVQSDGRLHTPLFRRGDLLLMFFPFAACAEIDCACGRPHRNGRRYVIMNRHQMRMADRYRDVMGSWLANLPVL